MGQKIFELAKELDVKPLDLVEDLKTKGFAVRNHMSSLSDEDIVRVMELFKAEAKASEDAKKTKKKTVRKKKAVTKKKTNKVSTVAEGAVKKVKSVKAKATTDAEEKKTKVTTVKKKRTVIRRKSSAADESEVAEVVTPQDTTAVEEQEAQVTPQTTEEVDSSGLRVVAAPEAEAAEEAEGQTAKSEEKEKELYEEPKRVHKFTPVFIPEKKEKSDEDSGDEGAQSTSDKEDDGVAKKRLGGLATMMSGKPKAGSKSRDINLSRAEEELKSYSALNSFGKPIYTPVKKKRLFTGMASSTTITEVKESKRVIQLHKGGLVKDIAQKLSVKFNDLADKALDINLLVKQDDFVGIDLASQLAALYNYRVEDKAFDEDAVLGKEELTDDQKEKLPLRNPIITIMGHVDHGKTTLIDYIRSTKVVSSEAGGITQHIGAYSVKVNDSTITFLDTPGHEAFGAMRQRGADVTDVVVLVVAADDGVMPQTKESIRFCQNAGVTLIVAINKMDKEGVNPDRIKQELSEFEIVPEEWGGDTQMIPISALKGDGVDDLLEAIALQAEMLELRAEPKGKAEGVVIESKIEIGRGPIATVLIQTGTLKNGDSIVVGESYGRARTMTDDKGDKLKTAGPSTPVQILGLNEAPSPGDILNVVKSEREAKKIVANRIAERKELESAPAKKKLSLEDFFATQASDQEQKDLNLIIRSDVQGSFEAIKQSLECLSNKEVAVKIIGGGVGAITDNDVILAESSSGFIIGFNMRPVTTARRLAEQKGVDVKTYSIIYELINDVKLALEGLLEPEFVEQFIGRAEVRETFVVPKVGTIAGSMVIDGKIKVGCSIRLLRQGKIVFDGKMSSLKRFKDDAKEVASGYECGIGLEDFNDIKNGDIFEAYVQEEKKRTLEDVSQAEAAAAAAAEKEAESMFQE